MNYKYRKLNIMNIHSIHNKPTHHSNQKQSYSIKQIHLNQQPSVAINSCQQNYRKILNFIDTILNKEQKQYVLQNQKQSQGKKEKRNKVGQDKDLFNDRNMRNNSQNYNDRNKNKDIFDKKVVRNKVVIDKVQMHSKQPSLYQPNVQKEQAASVKLFRHNSEQNLQESKNFNHYQQKVEDKLNNFLNRKLNDYQLKVQDSHNKQDWNEYNLELKCSQNYNQSILRSSQQSGYKKSQQKYTDKFQSANSNNSKQNRLSRNSRLQKNISNFQKECDKQQQQQTNLLCVNHRIINQKQQHNDNKQQQSNENNENTIKKSIVVKWVQNKKVQNNNSSELSKSMRNEQMMKQNSSFKQERENRNSSKVQRHKYKSQNLIQSENRKVPIDKTENSNKIRNLMKKSGLAKQLSYDMNVKTMERNRSANHRNNQSIQLKQEIIQLEPWEVDDDSEK